MGDSFRADPAGYSRTHFHEWFEDFDEYSAGQWTITETGSGTRAVGNLDGGVLVITNAAADDDRNFLQWSGTTNAATVETFKFTSGKRMRFKTRLKLSDATQSDFIIGLQTTDTTPLAVSDGVWFGSDDGDANLDFHVAASSVQTDVIAASTLSNDTYCTLEFYYDGSSPYFMLFKDSVGIGKAAITNAPTVTLTISIGHQNGEAVAKAISIDYIYVAVER